MSGRLRASQNLVSDTGLKLGVGIRSGISRWIKLWISLTVKKRLSRGWIAQVCNLDDRHRLPLATPRVKMRAVPF